MTKRKLILSITAKAGTQYVAVLRRHLPRAHQMLRSPLWDLSIALVGNVQMSALHEQFMQTPGPTDVLTFPLDLNARGQATSGEVIICVPYATREARKRDISVDRELLLYALHGMLHLSGFDDRTEADFKAMHRREDQILTRLGLGPVFTSQDEAKVAAPMKQPPRSRPTNRRRIHRRKLGA